MTVSELIQTLQNLPWSEENHPMEMEVRLFIEDMYSEEGEEVMIRIDNDEKAVYLGIA